VHPAAELFPLLSETDPAALKELAEDIRQHGQREPASYIKDSDGNRVLLDGRNRLDALEMLGRKIDINDSSMFEQLSLSIDAQSFIISKNIHRRHLNADKRDLLIAKLLKAKPETSNRQIAKMVDASHPHVAKVRKALEESGDVETVTTSIDTKGRKQPARKKKQPSNIGRLMVKDANGKSRPATKEEQAAAEDIGKRIFGSDSGMGTPCNMAAAMANPINTAWREGSEFNRANFVRLYLADVLKVAEQIKLAGQPNDDDGLNIPDYLKRVAP
jgi:ParB-like chromosome segregation protein Spo0J